MKERTLRKIHLPLFCLLLLLGSCNKYEDGPAISVHSAQNRIAGRYWYDGLWIDGVNHVGEINKYLLDDSTRLTYELEFEKRNAQGETPMIVYGCKCKGLYDLQNDYRDIYIHFGAGRIPDMVWQIKRLKYRKTVHLEATDSLGVHYVFHLRSIWNLTP